MVTTRSRVKQAEAAAAATGGEVAPDLPVPAPTTQRKRKNSVNSPTSSLTPAPKLAKTDLVQEELPRAPAPTPVAQLQPVAQSVDVIAAANAAAQDLAAMDVVPTEAPTKTAPLPTLRKDATMTVAATEPTLKAPSAMTMPEAVSTTTKNPSDTAATSDISALESVKEPTPELKPLPGVATVLTQPTVATLTTAVPMTTVGLDSNLTTHVPTALTAPQLSTISAPAPTPAVFPALGSEPAMHLTDTSVPDSELAPDVASAFTYPHNSAEIGLATERSLSDTPLETSMTTLTTHLASVNPTSLLLTPNTGMPEGTAPMTSVAAAPVASSAPASVVVLPTMTVATEDTLQPQIQAPGAKDMGGTTNATNDLQPQVMPQQQVYGPDKLSSVIGGVDAATAATLKAAAGGAHAKGPKMSGI